jgi:outer membrane biosynthesis protein TonB
VVLEGELDKVYQLQIPATSLFGEAKGNDMGLQAYIKFLSAHNTPAIAVMTELRFDEDSTAPKLYFRPVRGLDEEELNQAIEARDSDDAKKAIEMTVSQTDKVEDKPKAEKPKAEKPKAEKPKAAPAPEPEEDDEGEEPTKVEKAQKPAAPEPKSSDKLASILDGWDD